MATGPPFYRVVRPGAAPEEFASEQAAVARARRLPESQVECAGRPDGFEVRQRVWPTRGPARDG